MSELKRFYIHRQICICSYVRGGLYLQQEMKGAEMNWSDEIRIQRVCRVVYAKRKLLKSTENTLNVYRKSVHLNGTYQ